MRFIGMRAAAVCIALFSLVACSNDTPPPPPPTSPSVATSTIASGSSPSTPTSPPARPSALPASGGADAAPGVSGYYDASQEARAKFASWWNYEVQTDRDAAVPADKVYEAGVRVCISRIRGAGPQGALTILEYELGFTTSGAVGIYKSALEALCRQFNLGYVTDFDYNVETMVEAVLAAKVTYTQMPPRWDFGFFMKEACAALSKLGGTELWNHMISMSSKLALMEQNAISNQTLRIYLKAAVYSGCSALSTQLPPVIQMAY